MQNDMINNVRQCWCGMTWLDADVYILYAKRINLNNS
jgi:hypothetical protein